jgi:hypothetical protein
LQRLLCGRQQLCRAFDVSDKDYPYVRRALGGSRA